MAKGEGGGGGWMPPPTGFSSFSQEWEELSFQTEFLTVGPSFGASVHENLLQTGPSWP